MKAIRLLVAGSVAASLLTGCVTTTFKTGLPGGGAKKEERGTYFLYGLVGDKTLNLSELCPEGVSSFKDYFSAVDGILSCVTCGIYTPKSIEVECAGSARVSYTLTPDLENNRTWVAPVNAGGKS